MAFEFIQIPANGQGSAKEELNKLLRGGRIASVKKEFVSHGDDSFWAFCYQSRWDWKKDSGRRPSGSNRVHRGGNWNNNANHCRVANRNNNNPTNSNNNNIGFRVARSSDQRCRMAPP